jgi:MraZ protein
MSPAAFAFGDQLSGQHEVTIDSKGRVGLPQELRKHLDGEVTVLKWKDHLVVVQPEKFNRLAGFVGNRVSLDSDSGAQGFFNPKLQRDRRHFFGNMFELAFDAQGRLTIPKTLRESMSFVSDVVWIGCGDYVELWSKKAYDADCARWEEAGGYDELFAAPLPESPSAPITDAPGGEGNGREQA